MCRRGKNVMMITPCEISLGVTIKSQKINDVSALLAKHYGSDWQDINELSYYKNIKILSIKILETLIIETMKKIIIVNLARKALH